jgi:DNA-binding transcriptional LysR family regulator
MDRHHRARRRLKLRQLEILLAVADTGSMAKAATRLAISQPGVSRAIADAEHTLGVPLFDRSTQGVEPTQYGRALLKRGIAAFDEIDQGVKEIEFLADPTAGEVRIGSSAALSEGIVLAVINRLSRQYPRVVFHVAIVQGIDQLRERNVELGFLQLSGLVREEDIDLEMLFEDPLVVVAGAENPWVRRRKIKLADLVNEPWTWPPPGSVFDSLVVEAFRVNGLKPPQPAVYTHAVNMRISLAATGPFLAVVPAGIMRLPSKYPSIRMLPVELPTTHRQIGIVTLKNRTLSPLAQIFVECARDIAKRLPKGEKSNDRRKAIIFEPPS